jgi:hypothetical protein
MTVTETPLLERVVDTDRYPLSNPDNPARRDLVSRVRRELQDVGCCVLPDFIRRSLHVTLRQQAGAIAPSAHHDVEVVNAYNISLDTPLPPGHPARIRLVRGNAFVARDHIPERDLIHQLYIDPAFQRLIADCVGLPAVHPLADPLSGLCLNVVNPGMFHPWHFDTNEFSISILTQEAEAGGVFEYCPNIRSPHAENLDDVRGVLTGRRHDLVQRLRLRPGDLQLFAGRFSLHRVTTVHGGTGRHSAIFAYSERRGVVGSAERTRQLFGRVPREHLVATGQAGRVRGDQLLD